MPEYSAAWGFTPTRNTLRPYFDLCKSSQAITVMARKINTCDGMTPNSLKLVMALKLSGNPLMP